MRGALLTTTFTEFSEEDEPGGGEDPDGPIDPETGISRFDLTDIAFGDFNNDGALDLVTAHPASPNRPLPPEEPTLTLLRSQDENVTPIFSNNSSSPENMVSILLGNGDGTFEERVPYVIDRPTNGPNGFVNADDLSLELSDVNQDGAQDLLAIYRNLDAVVMLLGNGDGTFAEGLQVQTQLTPVALEIGDVNGDSFNDLVTAHATGNTVSVALGNRYAPFVSGQTFTLQNTPRVIKLTDFDLDGQLDILVGSQAGELDVILGDGTQYLALAAGGYY